MTVPAPALGHTSRGSTSRRASGRRRSTLAATTVAVALLGTAACSGGDDSPPTAGSTAVSPTAASSAEASESTTGPDPTAASPTPTESASASPSASTSATSDPEPVRVAGIQEALDADFPALVPSSLPAGWSIIDAQYAAGGGGSWTIRATTAAGESVSLIQTTATVGSLVARQLPGATKGATVDLTGSGTGRWTSYTSDDGRQALARRFSSTSALVASASTESVTTFTSSLLVAEDSTDLPDAG